MVEIPHNPPDYTGQMLTIAERRYISETIAQHRISSEHAVVILIGRIAALKYGFEVAPEAVTAAAVRELRLLIWEREMRLNLLATLNTIPDDAIREPLTDRAYV